MLPYTHTGVIMSTLNASDWFSHQHRDRSLTFSRGDEIGITTKSGAPADVVVVDASDADRGLLHVEFESGECEWVSTSRVVRGGR
jgi:hypothetical protein